MEKPSITIEINGICSASHKHISYKIQEVLMEMGFGEVINNVVDYNEFYDGFLCDESVEINSGKIGELSE